MAHEHRQAAPLDGDRLAFLDRRRGRTRSRRAPAPRRRGSSGRSAARRRRPTPTAADRAGRDIEEIAPRRSAERRVCQVRIASPRCSFRVSSRYRAARLRPAATAARQGRARPHRRVNWAFFLHSPQALVQPEPRRDSRALRHYTQPRLAERPLARRSEIAVDLALYQPDIAQNTGTLLRLGACLGVRVHIIHPTGFPFSRQDAEARRARLSRARRFRRARQLRRSSTPGGGTQAGGWCC